MMKLDFHVHTHYSIDSIIKPRELALKSKRLGIIFANTDHNTTEAHGVLRDLNVPFIAGEEIRTDRGDLIGLYMNDLIPKYTPFEEAIDRIHAQGGLAYLPHMYDKTRKGVIPKKEELPKLDIVETFNARCLSPTYNDQAESFAKQNGLIAALGSDSHFLFEFGRTYNELPDFDLDSPKELMRALKKATLRKKSAPFYVRGTTTFVAMTKKFGKKLGL
ncbi:PHP domain-containing protein [Candidatus Micrarchaeota archaeon]|nr:PHP domain-containing protein [Candidatus Micrarchaeota archaeon]